MRVTIGDSVFVVVLVLRISSANKFPCVLMEQLSLYSVKTVKSMLILTQLAFKTAPKQIILFYKIPVPSMYAKVCIHIFNMFLFLFLEYQNRLKSNMWVFVHSHQVPSLR